MEILKIAFTTASKKHEILINIFNEVFARPTRTLKITKYCQGKLKKI